MTKMMQTKPASAQAFVFAHSCRSWQEMRWSRDGSEMRQAADGEWYTEEEFGEYYQKRAPVMWHQARRRLDSRVCDDMDRGASEHTAEGYRSVERGVSEHTPGLFLGLRAAHATMRARSQKK